ncbi:MAG: helix-turn-helix transcriptional regulator [Pseudomonadales bacterium]|nr:helix-turn-helix transcriptional regulator [Pseudomonadales bacterium]
MLKHHNLRRLCTARDKLRTEDASITAIASAIGMSRFHFIRLFKSVFGETPHQYRVRYRMEAARRQLVESHQNVTDICMAVGYVSPGSFSAHFSRRFGVSPAALRERATRDGNDPTPHCITLLNAAWTTESQFSRSETDPD